MPVGGKSPRKTSRADGACAHSVRTAAGQIGPRKTNQAVEDRPGQRRQIKSVGSRSGSVRAGSGRRKQSEFGRGEGDTDQRTERETERGTERGAALCGAARPPEGRHKTGGTAVWFLLPCRPLKSQGGTDTAAYAAARRAPFDAHLRRTLRRLNSCLFRLPTETLKIGTAKTPQG